MCYNIEGESPNLCVVGILEMNANIKNKHANMIYMLGTSAHVHFRTFEHNQGVRKCRTFNLQDR